MLPKKSASQIKIRAGLGGHMEDIYSITRSETAPTRGDILGSNEVGVG